MSRSYDCADDEEHAAGVHDAASAVRRGELVVLPTDTVYGIGSDAFSPTAVAALLAAKGRGREAPPPVLVGSMRAAQALVEDMGSHGQNLIEEFWPGALTIVCGARSSLSWDLGDTRGTVALRMPMHPVALALLREVGPMAVSSANLSGHAPAQTATAAREQLEESVAVYLDGGECAAATPSTIVDLTYHVPRLLRAGAIPVERLRAVCGVILGAAGDEHEDDSVAPESTETSEPTETSAASEAPSGSGSEPDEGGPASETSN